MMMPGAITTKRPYLAAFASRYPHTTRLGILLRWVWWFAYGWPLVSLALSLLWLTVFGIPAIQLWMWLPIGGLIGGAGSIWSAVPKTRTGAIGVGLVVGGSVGWLAWRRRNLDLKKRDAYWKAVRTAVVVAGYLSAWWTLPLPIVALVHAMIPALWAVDIRMGQVAQTWWVRRQYASVRRDLPVHWAILAAKSPKVQSFDTNLEDTVSEVATNRPILEAPGLWPIASFDGLTVTVRAFRTPGRGLNELLDVLDELSAQFHQISDKPNSIELIWPDRSGSNFATTAYMRFHFKPGPYRDGGRVPGGPRKYRWPLLGFFMQPIDAWRDQLAEVSKLRPHNPVPPTPKRPAAARRAS